MADINGIANDDKPLEWSKAQILIGVAALLNQLAYCAAVILASLWFGYKGPALLGIVTLGVTFLAYSWQLVQTPRWVHIALSLASNLIGITAGLFLAIRLLMEVTL